MAFNRINNCYLILRSRSDPEVLILIQIGIQTYINPLIGWLKTEIISNFQSDNL